VGQMIVCRAPAYFRCRSGWGCQWVLLVWGKV